MTYAGVTLGILGREGAVLAEVIATPDRISGAFLDVFAGDRVAVPLVTAEGRIPAVGVGRPEADGQPKHDGNER